MNDILPADTPYWRFVEDTARSVFAGYGYREIRIPIVERTELFSRSIGEATDVVEKEMYTFADRNGDSLTLRPEATAGLVRAGIEHGLFHNQVQRLWCSGPMFRHERPQKGRYRQFHQLDVEAFGLPEAEVDAELILVSARLWRHLGLHDLRLELNSLGSREAQAAYRARLAEYFSRHRHDLDDDSRRRLETNPLRILDSKNPALEPLIRDAPAMLEHLDAESRAHFSQLEAVLRAAGVAFQINPRLVRGLDYYTRTVFEWVTGQLGAQSAVCGGGRYDHLVADIGGQPTPATGFAIGIERLVDLLKRQGLGPPADTPHAYLAAVGERAIVEAHPLAERLRERLPGLRLVVDAGEGGFKRKLRHADRSGASVALILGDDEVAAGSVAVKPLREDRPQSAVRESELPGHLNPLLDGPRG